MINAISSGVSKTTTPVKSEEEKKLDQTVRQLQGVFVEQLYKAMRDTVPQEEGIVTGGGGEEIFTGLMDQHLAAETPKHWEGGLTEALYRQLRRGLSTPELPVSEVPNTELSDR